MLKPNSLTSLQSATDPFSCCTIPVQYIEMAASGGEDTGSNRFKALKTLRLVRLSKMLRLARVKRILAKYEEKWNFSQNLTIFSLTSVILFAAHMLACFWYLVGTHSQADLPSGIIIPG